jgi:hypothetical protein
MPPLLDSQSVMQFRFNRSWGKSGARRCHATMFYNMVNRCDADYSGGLTTVFLMALVQTAVTDPVTLSSGQARGSEWIGAKAWKSYSKVATLIAK